MVSYNFVSDPTEQTEKKNTQKHRGVCLSFRDILSMSETVHPIVLILTYHFFQKNYFVSKI